VRLKIDALITYNVVDLNRWAADLAIRAEHPSVQQPPLAEGLVGL
jgi:hypothetical protein